MLLFWYPRDGPCEDGCLPTADEIQWLVVEKIMFPICFYYPSYLFLLTFLTVYEMTAPLTPITPNSTLGSPLSIQSQATLVNELRNNSINLEKDPIRDQSSSASLVLEKLQAILEYVNPPMRSWVADHQT